MALPVGGRFFPVQFGTIWYGQTPLFGNEIYFCCLGRYVLSTTFRLVTSCNTNMFGSQTLKRNGVLAAPTSSFGG